MSKSDEKTFQNKMINSLISNDWILGNPKNYMIPDVAEGRRFQEKVY